MTAVDLVQRLAELEQRVAALEGDARATTAPPEAGDSGVDCGEVGYGGRVAVGDGRVTWRIDVTPEHALALADRPRIEVLAALAHPVRVEIVRTLLGQGAQPPAALQEAARLGSTGQLYHHLKALTASGVVEQDKRGSYRLRSEAVVPVLVLLTAASDVAGQLRT
ncbi:ArsR/SmtB family transcription factor [Saccharothrix longispora]|uniref:DNA-binding transcriptional ArsR family regulator n=1 Tax=Saccharothrix longispora TaxID=33920 RepID=A0ABU1Q7H8_9PSEU|nr:helix-turn-helix domain-containing protein [Saccharothrix longispora]MDR6598826.1 DNA-binding transcriptional ArsR family regulator [Saccharothrix longispora]